MSLISSANSGSPALPYSIPNIGSRLAPVMGTGASTGAVRVSDPNVGLVLQTSVATPGSSICTVRAGEAAGSTLYIGSSGASPSTIVLTDGVMTVTGVANFTGGMNLSTITPTVFQRTIPGGAFTSGATTALPQPVGLPVGSYSIQAQSNVNPAWAPSVIAHWNGTSWTSGGNSSHTPLGGGAGATSTINNAGANLVFYHNLGSALTLDYLYFNAMSSN